MGLLEMEFSVLGEKQFDRAIRGIQDVPKDLSPIWEKISDDFRETEEQQFSNEGAFEGNRKWSDLSPKYAIVKAFRWGSVPILTASGKLRASLSVKGAEGSVNDIQPQGMTVGTSIEYGIYHQTGTSRMPAREPILLSDDQKKRWGTITRTELKDMINLKAEQIYQPVTF